jgi:AcrR family transcriptional regulator
MSSSVTTRSTRRVQRWRTTRDDVLLAACDVLDDRGISALTMANVAGRLGLTTMAVYRHVVNRDDLVDGVLDLSLGELAARDRRGGDWLDGVTDWMEAVRSHLRAHPWLGPLLGNSTGIAPAWLAAIGSLARIVERSPLEPPEQARALVWVTRMTLGTVLQELRAPLPHAAADADALRRSARAVDRPWVDRLVPELAGVTNDALFADLVDQTRRYLQSL